jgi:peroxiredoxin
MAVLAAALAFTTATAASSEGGSQQKAELGKKAPDFALKDTYGKTFTLKEFKDKIVVLEWVNHKCPFVVKHHDKGTMQDLYKKYAEKGVIWLGIDSSHFAESEPNRVYSAQKELNYPVLQDADGKTGKAYGATNTPHMFIIHKDGTLVYDGAIDDRGEKNYVEMALDELLAGKEVSTPHTDPYGCTVKYKN